MYINVNHGVEYYFNDNFFHVPKFCVLLYYVTLILALTVL